MSNIIQEIFSKINYDFPVNYIVLSILIVFFVSLFLPLFGKIIDLFEQLQYQIFGKMFGNKIAGFIINRITFIGTMTHELAHALFAKIFGAKVAKIHLIDFFGGDTLGHVDIAPRGGIIKRNLQSFYSSCAPVFVNCFLIILILFYWTQVDNLYIHILFVYLIISLLNHASMSTTDLGLYVKSSLIAVPITVIILSVILILFSKA